MTRTTKTVLIVDDDPDMTNMIAVLLEQAFSDLDIIQTHTIAAARRHLTELKPSLMLLDVELPDGNGLEWLQTRPQRLTPVLVLSSLDRAEQALRVGAFGFICKQKMGLDSLLSRVQDLLDSAGQTDAYDQRLT